MGLANDVSRLEHHGVAVMFDDGTGLVASGVLVSELID